ncbi:hypothetical protein MUK42_05142 [Musa troglodytarum]|uniref:Trichome birefringence-like C-terminal domain-containing protein n=1 Tax=Musa troglodytarum TaxID=320322 RepID=A0A9E7ERB3_9LILI|nr:hypothetical protein MUK42_05142 [Musa troglodytarum]URD81291.1 hypothetical protein MUK42_05142 [Musa troglodytarum]
MAAGLLIVWRQARNGVQHGRSARGLQESPADVGEVGAQERGSGEDDGVLHERVPQPHEDWGNPGGVKCAMETTPLANASRRVAIGTDWRLFAEQESVVRSMRLPVSLVRITALSELRKDAHTAVHTLRQGKLLTAEQQADPATYADCIHWCLPGLPDTWNEFLFARIASRPWRI